MKTAKREVTIVLVPVLHNPLMLINFRSSQELIVIEEKKGDIFTFFVFQRMSDDIRHEKQPNSGVWKWNALIR